MAPEVHALGGEKGKSYGKEADLWGLGVILHVMLSVTMPFGSDTDSNDIQEQIQTYVDTSSNPSNDAILMQGEVWNDVSDTGKSLIRGLLTADVKTRSTIHDAKNHPWMHVPRASASKEQRT